MDAVNCKEAVSDRHFRIDESVKKKGSVFGDNGHLAEVVLVVALVHLTINPDKERIAKKSQLKFCTYLGLSDVEA